jgi:type I restriction enzyme R subunit
VLEPFEETVNMRFAQWLKEQEATNRKFTDEQVEWLKMIKDHIAVNLSVEMEDFDYAPFYEKGGAIKMYKLFGDKLNSVLDELNETLAA